MCKLTDTCDHCGETLMGCGTLTDDGKMYLCDGDYEQWQEAEYESREQANDIDHWGYRDVCPEQTAGEVFQDRYDMYRREY